jgi:hypothetical protein
LIDFGKVSAVGMREQERLNRRLNFMILLMITFTVSAAFGQGTKANRVVVLDPSLPSVDILIKQLSPGSKIVYLRKTSDPLRSITKILKQCAPVSSLHIFLEGRPGVFLFAGAEVDLNNINESENVLSEWRQYFADDGDIFLYGCEIGKGDKGLAFVRALAMATGLDIAASDNLTGSDVEGGDWYLEVKSGTIEDQTVVDGEGAEKYPSILRKTPARNSKKENASI